MQIELDRFQSEGVTDPAVRELERDLLECQGAFLNSGLRPTCSDLIEAVRIVREARKGAKMGLLRAWEGASEDEREWLVETVDDLRRGPFTKD
jgi:hypothetical protein